MTPILSKEIRNRIVQSGEGRLYIVGDFADLNNDSMNAIYLTNETPRTVTVGNRKIVFRKSVPRNFAYQSELFPLVVSGMKEMGEENINNDVVLKLKKILAKETNQDLIRQDFLIAPQWIRKKLNVL